MTKEELINKYNNKFNEITMLQFSDKKSLLYISISDSPINYVELSDKFTNLKNISLDKIRSSDYYKSISEFVKGCNDDIRIKNELVGSATKEEFLRSEEKINEIINNINPEWNIKQKTAYVHYMMGKMISYSPDFCFSGKYVGSKAANDSRNIWKSIDSGMSVCNGITDIQRNILSRMGIKTKELSSGTHSFLMVETEDGNIITDATWDLTNTLFEARPMYFGKTYEQIVEIDGPLSHAHRLEEPPKDIIEISDDELREIYHSIGITNEDRKFKLPILEKVDAINKQSLNTEKEKIDSFLKMFEIDFSKEANHLSETRTMLENCFGTLGIDDKNVITKFVYSKDDKECEKPHLCIHFSNENMQNNMVVLNNEEGKFENVGLESFDNLYKSHDEDTREPFWKKYIEKEKNQKSIEIEKV